MLTLKWQAICSAYCGEAYGSTDFSVLENVRDAILRMTYYWYNKCFSVNGNGLFVIQTIYVVCQ